MSASKIPLQLFYYVVQVTYATDSWLDGKRREVAQIIGRAPHVKSINSFKTEDYACSSLEEAVETHTTLVEELENDPSVKAVTLTAKKDNRRKHPYARLVVVDTLPSFDSDL